MRVRFCVFAARGMAILSSLFLFHAIAVTVCLKNNLRVQFRQNYCDSSRNPLLTPPRICNVYQPVNLSPIAITRQWLLS
ncbi:exported hypothetical protein [Agrobacterium deltaense RV3]|nr:exported hypothetical protein [Agrobacterium deltaense RV3]